MRIKALQLLPPLAFARLGSASEPQDNFEIEEDPLSLAYRKIIPGATLKVAEDGTPTLKPAADPSTLEVHGLNQIFRDGDRIRPVAPFFQVFAIMEGDENFLVPLTVDLLNDNNISLSSLKWSVRVENRKVFRRTGDTRDIVTADTGLFSNYSRIKLGGTSPFFTPGATLDFGFVQFVKPEQGCPIGSQIRLRFTPGPGKIYGPFGQRPGRKPDDFTTPIYRGSTWPDFSEKTPTNGDKPRETLPPSLYANEALTPPWLNGEKAKSRGLIDDACDGFVEVMVEGFEGLRAKARVCVGPPSFVPDVRFIRTLADDLDQVVNGPNADDLDLMDARKRTLDIIRRAYEAVSFMNVAIANGNDIDGRPASEFDTMPAEEAFATDRRVWPVMPPSSVDTAAILALHQQIFAAVSAGAAPWFARLLRKPDEVGDLTDRGRRKMPALMSGADSFYLALTHRQIATVERAAQGLQLPRARNQTAAHIKQALTDQLACKLNFNPVNSRPEMAIANCCPGLEVDFRAVWRRLFEGIELSEHENLVVGAMGVDADGKRLEWLKGHRLLKVNEKPVIVTLKGPPPAALGRPVTAASRSFPGGIATMEWSNCFAQVVNELRDNGKREVDCVFTKAEASDPAPLNANQETVRLRIRDFFEGETAVISFELASPGELTQGLCSPWQNDLRECSCFYWASSRPDFVNTSVGDDGLTHGDYWLAKTRNREYVPDDYTDSRLIGYEDLFRHWELLQFQIGGQDSAPDLPSFDPERRSRKS